MLRFGKGTLDHASQHGQEPMRFHDVVIFEGCYGPDQRGMHLLQLLRRRLLHQAINTIPNAPLAVIRRTVRTAGGAGGGWTAATWRPGPIWYSALNQTHRRPSEQIVADKGGSLNQIEKRYWTYFGPERREIF